MATLRSGKTLLPAEDVHVTYRPTDFKEEDIQFRSGSHWNKEHLDALGVRFMKDACLDWKKLLGVERNGWTEDMEKRKIDNGVWKPEMKESNHPFVDLTDTYL